MHLLLGNKGIIYKCCVEKQNQWYFHKILRGGQKTWTEPYYQKIKLQMSLTVKFASNLNQFCCQKNSIK